MRCPLSVAVARIEAVRHAFGMNKRDFAHKIGVSPTLYSDVTSGRRGVTHSLAERVGWAAGVNVVWLLEGKGDAVPGLRGQASDFAYRLKTHLATTPAVSPEELMSLPVFEHPIEGSVYSFMHMARGLRRSVSRDLWGPARYFLQVSAQLDVPDEVRPKDMLLVETQILSWKGTSKSVLCVVKYNGCVMLRRFDVDWIAPNRVLAHHFQLPQRRLSLPGGRYRILTEHADTELDLLGIGVRLERDLPIPGPYPLS